LGVAREVTHKLIEALVVNSMPEFEKSGGLYPVLEICVASLLMYDKDVRLDFKEAGKGTPFIHVKLRQAFVNAHVFDQRAAAKFPPDASDALKAVATLDYWGEIIRDDFVKSNTDFQPLTDSSNSKAVIDTLNRIGKSNSDLYNENRELRNEIKILRATIETDREEFRSMLVMEREEHRQEREELRREREEFKTTITSMAKTNQQMHNQFTKYLTMFNLPDSPLVPRHSNVNTNMIDESMPPPTTLFPASTAPVLVAPVAASASGLGIETQVAALASDPGTLKSNTASVACASGAKRSADNTSKTKPPASKRLVENYNFQSLHSQGTNTEDIITNAYYKQHFSPGGEWTFGTISRDAQFTDNAKFRSCLQLFEVVATDADKRALEEPNLNATELHDLAVRIAQTGMQKLLELEGQPTVGRYTRGYTGVGKRVRAIKTKLNVSPEDKHTTLLEAIRHGATTTKMTDYY
jgi:hypothetical protein